MGKKKKNGSGKQSQGILVDLITSMIDGSVPPALITSVYLCLSLVLVVGLIGLFLAGAHPLYFVIWVFIVFGFFISFTWFISEADFNGPNSRRRKDNK